MIYIYYLIALPNTMNIQVKIEMTYNDEKLFKYGD